MRDPGRGTRFRRWAAAATLAATLLGLSGCGDGDADQRKAFVTFLQTRIIDKPGIHVPQPTDDERTSFGPYADQYAIITDFHRVMNDTVVPKLSAAMAKGGVTSVGELVERRGDLEMARAAMDDMATTLRSDLVRADDAHRKLQQPDDLKPVFDTAYDRLVTSAAATFAEVVPVADKAFAAAVDVADYLQKHRDRVTVSGASLQVADPKTQAELNGKLQALQGTQQAVQDAQGKLQAFVYGTGG